MTQQPNERLLPCLDRLQRALDDTVEGIVEVSAADLREALSAWNTRVPAVQDEGMVARVAKAIFGVEYAHPRPIPMVEPPWVVCIPKAKAAIQAIYNG